MGARRGVTEEQGVCEWVKGEQVSVVILSQQYRLSKDAVECCVFPVQMPGRCRLKRRWKFFCAFTEAEQLFSTFVGNHDMREVLIIRMQAQ